MARPTVRLSARFATDLPELAVPWEAAATPDPRVLVLNEPLAADLGLDVEWLRSPDGVGFLTGTRPPDGAQPVAQGYAGHQFGGYSPRLGDGRAMLLGELATPVGGLVDVHLKGSGRTPFARGGDGLAAVGPMLREYVVSEAMHALGIPTTRALAVVATGRAVQRETPLPGAVLTRVAASHLRVGSFQYAAALQAQGGHDGGAEGLVGRLVDHAVARHHPALAAADRPALELFRAVVAAQADLVARWMGVGFVHGVMNTDNTTISGETIDYGPCAFLDAFDPATVFSSIDEGGRYAFGNQPGILEWNLARLAEALLPLLAEPGASQDDAVAVAVEALRGFGPRYGEAWSTGLRAKLGLAGHAVDTGPDDVLTPLLTDLLDLMRTERVDHTGFFVALGAGEGGSAARDLVLDRPALDAWLDRWRALGPDTAAMARTNPVYVPRNHLVEAALDAATEGDLGAVDALVDVVREPFGARPGLEAYAEPAPAELAAGYQTFCGT